MRKLAWSEAAVQLVDEVDVTSTSRSDALNQALIYLAYLLLHHLQGEAVNNELYVAQDVNDRQREQFIYEA